jgi:hypothetical protein
MDRVHGECPDVGRKLSYAVLGGPADYLDIFTATDTFVELMRSLRPASAAA